MNKKLYSYALLVFLLCSGCKQAEVSVEKTHDERIVIYDLDESTQIIMQLIKENSLKEILADKDPAEIDTLLKNFSPSEMAIEAEALNFNGIAALIFFKPNDEWKKLRPLLVKIAETNPAIKFVQIDADKLYKVTQNAQIETFPALVLIRDRKEVGRIEPITNATLHADIADQLKRIT